MRAPSGIFDGKVLIVAGADRQNKTTLPENKIRTLDVIQRNICKTDSQEKISKYFKAIITQELICWWVDNCSRVLHCFLPASF